MARRSSSVTSKDQSRSRSKSSKNAGNTRRSSRRTAIGLDSDAKQATRRPKSSEGGISDQDERPTRGAARGSTQQRSRSRKSG